MKFTKLLFISWKRRVEFRYLSFREALPSVGTLRQQRVQKLHSLSERRQQHGCPDREGLNHHLRDRHSLPSYHTPSRRFTVSTKQSYMIRMVCI